MTKQQCLADLALAEKATQEPWEFRELGGPDDGLGYISHDGLDITHSGVTELSAEENRDNAIFTIRARTALPEYAKALIEAMELLESRFGVVFHGADCNFDGVDVSLCDCGVERARDFIAIYRAQEKSE